MDGGGIVVRGDHHDLGAAPLRLPQVMGVRNAGDVGIETPQHDVIHLEPGIERSAHIGNAISERGPGEHVADRAGGVEAGRAEQRTQAQRPRAPALRHDAGAGVKHERPRAVLRQCVHELVRDLAHGLIPGDALPLALAARARALERIEQAILFVHGLGVDRSLVAAAGIGVGDIRADLRILRELFLARHHAVLGEYAEGAVALAVRAVKGKALGIAARPGEFLAVEILPGAVGVRDKRIVHRENARLQLLG